MKSFQLRTEFITLGQLLKAANVVSSGVEAKTLLFKGGTTVNGLPEDRRGKKLRVGDEVKLANGETIRIE